jgi:hypothetical protein
LDLEPARRTAFLDEACAGDRLLRQEVEALLANEEQEPEFLELPALEVAASVLAGQETQAAPEPLPAGLHIGPYRIVVPVGGGGMGEVYRATDTRLGRDVALKFLPAGSARDPEALKRFQREARAASALNHPNICTLHDIGEHEGQPFLVMELLEGQSLKERVASGSLPPGEVLELALQITAALEAAHSKGIVHRDIKPGNIFLTGPKGRPGQAKILDFGLAKLLSEPFRGGEAAPVAAQPVAAAEMTISLPGRTMGTVAYMSPEQARGEEVDARTDLFSLGVTLYQVATGALPFQGESPELTLEAILARAPVRPRERKPGVSHELERVILKALEKDCAARYQTAAELCADLERLRAVPRRARWPVAATAVMVLVVAAAIGVRWGWFGAQPQTPELTPRQVTANPVEDPVVRAAISPDGEYLAYADLTGIHVRRIDSGETRSIPPQEGYCFR